MTLGVESYIGARGGPEGVKLEEQVLVTERGVEVLSRFPVRRRAARARDTGSLPDAPERG